MNWTKVKNMLINEARGVSMRISLMLLLCLVGGSYYVGERSGSKATVGQIASIVKEQKSQTRALTNAINHLEESNQKAEKAILRNGETLHLIRLEIAQK